MFLVARIITGITFIFTLLLLLLLLLLLQSILCMNWSHHLTASWENWT